MTVKLPFSTITLERKNAQHKCADNEVYSRKKKELEYENAAKIKLN